MLVKIHKSYRLVVGICDSDLIGQKFESATDSGVVSQIDLTGNFFKGEEKTHQEAIEIIEDCQKEDATFVIVGKESVNLCEGIGIISKKGIIKIGRVPVALVLM